MKLRKLLGTTALCVLSWTQTSYAETTTDFDAFLTELRAELQTRDIPAELFDEAFGPEKAPDLKVLSLLVKQPESTFSFAKYHASMLSPQRINTGAEKLRHHAAELEGISGDYGVPAEVIVALWGIETLYGTRTGSYSVVRSLSTLAFASHRKEFFRKELFAALQILKEGHIQPVAMKGSWAGAMGQCQFMPSSFQHYAKDGNRDGHKNIWGTPEDVFASTANYLSSHKWHTGEKWGERVVLSRKLPKLVISPRGLSDENTIAEWKKMGISSSKGALGNGDDTRKARLFMPEGPTKKSYLVYDNFNVVMAWNRSVYFAFSVLTLADELAKARAS
jgi:membrane-bound lytic murein transglycosylase B